MRLLSARSVFLATLLVSTSAAQNQHAVPDKHNEATVAQLQAEMASHQLTSEELTKEYLARIIALDQDGPGVNSVIEVNPDALVMARKADALRRRGIVLGPLHGIPVLLKDNIGTGDKMQTSAGSFALVGSPALSDSTVAANLRAGGAVILGKTNLSEWANFRSFESVSGWSGRGGQTNNPYGINRNPCGSSSGSGAAASANFAAKAYCRFDQPRRRCPYLAYARHGRPAWTHRRGCRSSIGRHSESDLRWTRSGDRRGSAGLAGHGQDSSHEHPYGLHAVRESQRPSGREAGNHARGVGGIRPVCSDAATSVGRVRASSKRAHRGRRHRD